MIARMRKNVRILSTTRMTDFRIRLPEKLTTMGSILLIQMNSPFRDLNMRKMRKMRKRKKMKMKTKRKRNQNQVF